MQTEVQAKNSERLQSLNALRGVAALFVAIDHIILLTARPSPDSVLFYCATFIGAAGVGAFFLLSGFVIFLSLEKTRPSEFLVNRVYRLYPVIVVAVVIRMLSQIWMGTRHFDLATLKIFLFNISLFGNLFIPIDRNIEPIVWTLSIEVKFYLLMAALFSISKGARVFHGLVASAVALGCLGMWFPPISKPFRVDMALAVSCLPVLLMGTAICMRYKERISQRQLVILIGIFLVALSFAPLPDNVSFYKNLTAWIVAAVGFTGCVFSERFSQWVNKPWLLWLGAVSYPLYAIHSAVAELLVHLSPSATASALILRSTVLSLLVAYLLHRFVENPVQTWSKRRVSSQAGLVA